MMKASILVLLVLVTIHSATATSRSIRDNSTLISNGMDQKGQSNILQLGLKSTNVTCEPTYGFLPCTTEVWGQLFLIVVYEYLLSLSSDYITSGSNLFFQIFGTGIFGASLFHILAIFPQLLLVLVTGVSASESSVESMTTMGMGLVAGSAIMNLTLVSGSIVAFGSYNLSQTSSSSNQENKGPFSLTGYGVSTDAQTKDTARIMLLSMIPFLLLQLAKILNSSSATRVVVLVSLVITLVIFITYCVYQVFQPWMQSRRLEYLMLKYAPKSVLQVLRTSDGKPNEAAISKLFGKIDQNNNKSISAAELRALTLGLQVQEVGLNKDDFFSKLMEEFNVSGDSNVTETQFIQGLTKGITNANPSVNIQGQKKTKSSSSSTNSEGTTEEQQSLLATDQDSNDADEPAWWNYTKATFLILLGTAMAILLATPLMTSLRTFATAINIPSFLVSYLVVPLASNFRMAYGAITSATQKTENTISLALSEIYSGVFVNNMMSLVIFLALVYIRDLSWDVSAEILIVLIICTAVGLSASFSTKLPLWTSIIAYALYPISLAFIYVLTTVLGWS